MKKLQLLVIGLFFVSPLFASADIGSAFGGYIPTLPTSIIPCTCSTGYAINYSPLYINSNVPTVGALWYSGISILFSWYNPITPGTWDLGSFIPGAGECWLAGTPCVLYPTEGAIYMEGTGAL